MTTSAKDFPQRLSKIDSLALPDHYHLDSDDDCYYLGDYTARENYSFSKTNSLIWNFKKSMDRSGHLGWHYKAEAIQTAADAFRVALGDAALDTWTFVPMPPSKAKDDPLYDDRITRMLQSMRSQPPVDVRELIFQAESTVATHERPTRFSPEELEDLWSIDETLAQQPIAGIAIVDDLLTAGAHFRAAKSILSGKFPTTKIIGLFIARRAPNSAEVQDLPL